MYKAKHFKNNINYIYNIKIIAVLIVLITFYNTSGILSYFSAKSTIENVFKIAGTYNVQFNANNGTDAVSNQKIFVHTNTKLNSNTFTREGYIFTGWNTLADGTGTRYEDEEIVIDLAQENMSYNLYAQWIESDGVAEVNGRRYSTLQEAVYAVPNDKTQTVVKLLCDVNECVLVGKYKNIIFDLQNYKIINNADKPTIENNGIVVIQNGIITETPESAHAVINNNPEAVMKITGGTIVALGELKSQAIYNNNATLEISGNPYICAETTNRATITCVNGGTLKITGGTIISYNYSALSNIKISNLQKGGNIVIGNQDGNADITSPVLQGKTYGVEGFSNSIKIYDGILKGQQDAINDQSCIMEEEYGFELLNGEEIINEENYKTLYLTPGSRVTLNPNGGEVTPNYKFINSGDSVGDLPTPTRDEYMFVGWYTEADGGEKITEDTVITEDVTYYAHWKEVIHVTFDPNGGTTQTNLKLVLSGEKIGQMPTPRRNRYTFIGWFTEQDGGEKITEDTIITGDITYYAHWIVSNVAKINGVEYETLQKAIDAVPTNNEEIKIEMICDDAENVIVGSDQNIVFDFGDFILSNENDFAIIENSGTIKIINGTITSSAGFAAINNYNTLKMTGGSIIATGTRQAIYNRGGNVEISGTTYLSSDELATDIERGTIHNLDNGIVTVTGGTIFAKNANGIFSASGTVTIGKDDENVSNNSPVIIGYKNGIKSRGILNFYDGMVKVPSDKVLFDATVINVPEGYKTTIDIETIDDASYKIGYLEEE